jgi:hypothetical protein
MHGRELKSESQRNKSRRSPLADEVGLGEGAYRRSLLQISLLTANQRMTATDSVSSPPVGTGELPTIIEGHSGKTRQSPKRRAYPVAETAQFHFV